ncbi:unnamed protein product [Arabidopsis arenosa]|uniref:EF-hand domain-containing protein n=1 Tax=Arabidopsis arenosa TaxID=38785 RepID=A0A8S1ZMN4_ARAAE|nr:unnamed protein product [Arabidopsis arenosa]
MLQKVLQLYFERERSCKSRAFLETLIKGLFSCSRINASLFIFNSGAGRADFCKALNSGRNSERLDCDINLDGEIDRDEFVKFIEQITAETFNVVSQGLIISLIVAPTVAIATKKATEGVPGVGKVVQKLPTSIYASLVTLAVVWVNSDSS